ncbi:ubiquinol-cytochrome c reductase iron-sulfur subunit [Methylocystis sp. B8]|uniref:ubiquinol-cytochrome c reductase iron-sulfur subunit n=1 Tax=Methylocystis sp. B8 TaxID=544938 RepID=UPI001FED4E8C|nr:ubiquinol-cytochrome c reductase iron-sulfur subunit [Methylocystis sp. B8]
MINRSQSPSKAPAAKTTRRNFLFIATATTGVAGAAASLVPLIDQMNPDASTLAAGGPVDIDLGQVEPGGQVVILWRKKPIFVVFRTQENLQVLQSRQLLSELADPESGYLQQPPYAKNWHRSLMPEIGVYVAICTHLGCIPQFDPLPNATDPAPNWLGGYFCACHGSKYDLAGRVFRDVPAPIIYRFRHIASRAIRQFESGKIRQTRTRLFNDPPNVKMT